MGRALSRPLRVSGRPISNLPQFLNKGALKAYRISRSRKLLVAATRSAPHLTRETISVRSGPGPVCENLRLSLPSPEKTWTGEGGGINSGGDMEAHPCLMRFLTNLARLCASKSANGPRKNSFRPDSPSQQPPIGDGRLRQPPHHTGHGPFRTRLPNLS